MPVSIISVISKILERCLYENTDNALSRHQMGYRKGYSSHHSLRCLKNGRKI